MCLFTKKYIYCWKKYTTKKYKLECNIFLCNVKTRLKVAVYSSCLESRQPQVKNCSLLNILYPRIQKKGGGGNKQPNKRIQCPEITYDLIFYFFYVMKNPSASLHPLVSVATSIRTHPLTFLFLSYNAKASFVYCLGEKCRAVFGLTPITFFSLGLASPFERKYFPIHS